MLKQLLITAGIVALSVLFLCIKLLLKPGSKFGAEHIGENKAMRKRGIHCVQSMDSFERREKKHAAERIDPKA